MKSSPPILAAISTRGKTNQLFQIFHQTSGPSTNDWRYIQFCWDNIFAS
eukprot:COSAG06_NODE_46829_length_344_cov_0.563265_1_plen_48_part_01